MAHAERCRCGCVPQDMMSMFQMAELRAKRRNEEKELTKFIAENITPSDTVVGQYDLNLYNIGLTFVHKRPFQTISQKIVSLYIDNNNLADIPEGILQSLVSLRNLALHNNRLTAIPSDIGELRLLEECRLDHNDLIALPVEMGRCVSLILLHLSGNKQLTSLPYTFGNLDKLHHILMDDVPISALPLSMHRCASLELIVCDVSVMKVPPPDVIAAGGESIRAHLRSLIDTSSCDIEQSTSLVL